MNKMLGTVAAAAMVAAIALPAPATAAERQDVGIHKQVTDFSSHRSNVRHRHYVRRYAYPRTYSYGGYYGDPYYSSYGYPYYRSYPYYGYGPGVGVRIGPFGFGVW